MAVKEQGAGTALVKNAVGLPDVIFQSITTMAPAAGAGFSIVIGAYFAGGALPASVVLALIACLFIAYSIGEMAQHIPSAGGLATYAAQGLGGTFGFLVAWGYALTYVVAVPYLLLLFGNLIASTFAAEFGWSYSAWWVPGVLACAVIVFVINYGGIRMSTRAGVILGAFEILVLLAFAFTLIGKGGGHKTRAVFGTKFSTVTGFTGASGIIAGSVYAVLAFIGFDAAAPLGEEARNPRRTIKRAVVLSCLFIGLFYVVVMYGTAVFYGPARYGNFPTFGDGNPFEGLARQVWGWGWVIMFLAFLNSLLACTNGCVNACTRVIWSMGRVRVLPSFLNRTSPKYRSPSAAFISVFAVGTIVALWLGRQYDPVTGFALTGTAVVALVIPVYMITLLASLGFFLRGRRSDFHVVKHGIVPLVGVAILVPPLLAAVGIPAFNFISRLSYPLTLAGIGTIVWYAIGIVVVLYLRARHPDRIAATAHVFGDDEAEAAAVPPASSG